MSLYSSLVAYWKLDEASGNAVDSIGSSTLTDTNTVGSNTGLVYPLARQFTPASSETFVATSNAALQAGDIAFWIYAAVYMTSKANHAAIVSKVSTTISIGNLEYSLRYIMSPTDLFNFQVSNGTTAPNVSASNLGSPALNTWYQIFAWHDPVANRIGILVDDNLPDYTAITGGIRVGTGQFAIGRVDSTNGQYWPGRIGPVAIGKGELPEPVDFAYLYNNSQGRTLEEFSEFEPATETFDASDTWAVPSGVERVFVKAWGGGAAGYQGVVGGGGAGGGGGAYAEGDIPVTPSGNYTVTVGGTSSGAGEASGITGDSSEKVEALGGSFPVNSFTGGVGGQASGSTGNFRKFSGGNGGVPGSSAPRGGGGGGGGAGPYSAGGTGGTGSTPAGGAGGAGGVGGGGDGGRGGNGGTAFGLTPGVVPGGGGGGAGESTGLGADGAAGRVILAWIAPPFSNRGRRQATNRGVLGGVMRGAR